MYKIELHMHTKYTSPCGHMDEKELVTGYLNAGYQAVVVTDHYNRDAFRHLGMNTKEEGDFLAGFLTGYCHVKAEGERRGLKVYRGAEVRFDGSMNDYLVFGYSDALLADPERVFTMGLEKFVKLVREDGALLVQAHPFREYCTVADHRFLDGVETRNMHPYHRSHNELAQEYADRWPALIRTSGSDCHEPSHLGRGGILTKALPEDERALAALLRSGDYELIG